MSAPTPVYRNPARTTDERVADLLARMSPAEKIGQFNSAPKRLSTLVLTQY